MYVGGRFAICNLEPIWTRTPVRLGHAVEHLPGCTSGWPCRVIVDQFVAAELHKPESAYESIVIEIDTIMVRYSIVTIKFSVFGDYLDRMLIVLVELHNAIMLSTISMDGAVTLPVVIIHLVQVFGHVVPVGPGVSGSVQLRIESGPIRTVIQKGDRHAALVCLPYFPEIGCMRLDTFTRVYCKRDKCTRHDIRVNQVAILVSNHQVTLDRIDLVSLPIQVRLADTERFPDIIVENVRPVADRLAHSFLDHIDDVLVRRFQGIHGWKGIHYHITAVQPAVHEFQVIFGQVLDYFGYIALRH